MVWSSLFLLSKCYVTLRWGDASYSWLHLAEAQHRMHMQCIKIGLHGIFMYAVYSVFFCKTVSKLFIAEIQQWWSIWLQSVSQLINWVMLFCFGDDQKTLFSNCLHNRTVPLDFCTEKAAAAIDQHCLHCEINSWQNEFIVKTFLDVWCMLYMKN